MKALKKPVAAIISCSQAARDKVARPVSEEKPEGLDNCHNRERDAHGCGGLCIDFPHKIGVYHYIERGDQHTDDGGYCQ